MQLENTVNESEFINIIAEEQAYGHPKYEGEFLEDAKKLAIKYIDRWFCDKEMCCGGPIPKNVLYDLSNIMMVLNTPIGEGADKAYAIIEKSGEINTEPTYEGGISDDVVLVLGFLRKSSSLGIPKVFQGGLLLMHLEICHGMF